MFQNLIKEHINRLNINDIDKFAKDNNIFLDKAELNNLLVIIKNDWYELLYGDFDNVFRSNRNKINENNYTKIKELFMFFKKKYQGFL